MTLLDAIVVGLIQGLAEFLPISSSGHLAIARYFYGTEISMTYIILLHVGTLIAVVAALWKDIWKITVSMITGEGYGRKIAGAIIVATIPAAFAGFFFASKIDAIFLEKGMVIKGIPIEPYKFVGLAFILTATLLLKKADNIIKERTEKKIKGIDENGITWQKALNVGLMQIAAIVPGISRSGATITGGLQNGFSRKFAAKFSFHMSIPIILGSLVHELPKLKVTMPYETNLSPMLIGIAVAAVSGFFAIKFMIHLLTTSDMRKFIAYLWIIGLICIAS